MKRSRGVDVKIGQRFLGGPIVRRLCGRVDNEDDFFPVMPEKIFYRAFVANIEIVMGIARIFFSQKFPVPNSRAILTEKILAQIVVDTRDFKTFVVKKFDGFAPNQSGGARDYNNTHNGAK